MTDGLNLSFMRENTWWQYGATKMNQPFSCLEPLIGSSSLWCQRREVIYPFAQSPVKYFVDPTAESIIPTHISIANQAASGFIINQKPCVVSDLKEHNLLFWIPAPRLQREENEKHNK